MNITRILTLGGLAAVAAFAQSTGTITITGRVPESISMTNQSGTLLSTTQDLGDLIVSNNSTMATLASPIGVQLRSNKAFKLIASVATITNITAGPDAQAITLRDIGFGITGMQVTGASVGTDRTGDAVAPVFDYRGTNAVTAPVTNGKSPFDGLANHGSLADLGSTVLTGTQVVTGNRISNKGNITSDDNFMLLGFNVAVLPQYFSPTTGFSAVITLTPSTL